MSNELIRNATIYGLSDAHLYYYQMQRKRGNEEKADRHLTLADSYAKELAERTGYWKWRRPCEVLERILEKQ